MGTEEELRKQTEKMLNEIREKRRWIVIVDNNENGLIKNVDAYISDTKHFLDKKDFVRAFEAVVYAWGIIETLERTGIIRTERAE